MRRAAAWTCASETDMVIESCAVPPFEKNGYVVARPVTGEAIVIDPGDEVDQLVAIVRRTGVTVRHHADALAPGSHLGVQRGQGRVGCAAGAPRRRPVPVRARGPAGHRVRHPDASAAADRRVVRRAAALDVGDCTVDAHHTPGHSPVRSACRSARRGSPTSTCSSATRCLPARSAAPTFLAAIDALLRSVRDVLFPLGDDCRVHPGHGPGTTIGEERRSNPFLR